MSNTIGDTQVIISAIKIIDEKSDSGMIICHTLVLQH